jgi:hypothetical protein
MKKSFFRPLLTAALVLGLSLPALADTIRLKDGSVFHGQVVGFKDQQFTILMNGARGRRTRITVYMEDVESIEFDSAGSASMPAGANEDTSAGNTNTEPVTQRPSPPPVVDNQPSRTQPSSTPLPTTTTNPSASPGFFQINVRVRGDNASNGWTNSGLVVRRGQRLRLTASGRVNLGNGRFSTPDGLPNVPDKDKLMRTEPTGGLIAVIGDDNDEFIFIGRSRDFVAKRDGVLFLGVNEGNLSDNSGAFDVVIEAEAAGSASQP